jgi:Ca2+-binding EF-hand superfamily protein
VLEGKLTNVRSKFPNFKRYFLMKLQVLLCVYTCTLTFHAQADEPAREKPDRPVLEKRMEDRRKNDEKTGELRHRPEVRGDMFAMMDENSDGVITSEEFFTAPRMVNMPQEQRDKFFARIDLDGDGKVTLEEIRKMQKESHERQLREFRDLDTDKSGGLSFEEFSLGKFFSKLPDEKRRQIFERMDTNSDGQINSEDRPKGPRPEGREKGEKPRKRPTPDDASDKKP